MKNVNWISNKTDRPFYARKEIKVKGGLRLAWAQVTGLGQFIFSINGKKAGDHELDPGWTNYNKRIQYVEFDITDLLQEGINAAGIEVGNGWYIRDNTGYIMKYPAFKPPIPNPYKPFAQYLAAAVRVKIEYADGGTEYIETDEGWKTAPHPVIHSNVYGSEIIDGRLIQRGWNTAGFNDSFWPSAFVLNRDESPKGKLIKQTQPPVTVKKTFDAEFLYEKGDFLIYDLKQNMAGILEFEIKGNSGDKIEVYTAEKLDSGGNIDQTAKGWGLIDVKETCIIGNTGAWEQFRMHFTYFAGRYLGIKADKKGELALKPEINIRNIKGHYITNASRDTGVFVCDDPRYLKIYNLILRAVECNLLSVHTDCPSIERFAWQEPNHLMAPSIMYMKDVNLLWKKFLLDMRIDQCTKEERYSDGKGGFVFPGEGLIPAVAPRYEDNVIPSPLGSFFDIVPWGSACILGTWRHYWFYGEKNIIEENYEAGKKYLEHLKRKINPEGFINHGLGDWGNPDRKALARENVETAFLYADAKALSEFAMVLNKQNDFKEYSDYAESVKENYNNKLLQKHPENGLYCYRVFDITSDFYITQACQALPLYWGMVPDEKKDDVKNAFSYIMKRDNAFISGEVGLPYIIQTMNQNGMNDLICEFILKEKHPSYYAFTLNGETTLGEFWEDNPRSRCHDMMGHIIEWYYNGIAGIIPLEPGFSKIVIKPYLPKTMNHYTCSYDSIQGRIAVSLLRFGKDLKIEITLPEGVEYVEDSSQLERQGYKTEWIINRRSRQ